MCTRRIPQLCEDGVPATSAGPGCPAAGRAPSRNQPTFLTGLELPVVPVRTWGPSQSLSRHKSPGRAHGKAQDPAVSSRVMLTQSRAAPCSQGANWGCVPRQQLAKACRGDESVCGKSRNRGTHTLRHL